MDCDEANFQQGASGAPDSCAEETRELLRERFEALLDRALGAEQPPEGLAGSFQALLEEKEPGLDAPGTDRHALWSALVALTQEIKLQGRAFKGLQETLAPLSDLPDQVSRNTAALDRERLQEATERGRGELLETLLDLRDRLLRGEQGARAHLARARADLGAGRWLPWGGPRKVVRELISATEAFVKGYRLALDRLGAALEPLGVVEIRCEGLPFDPHKMKAVDLAQAQGVAAGTVLEVYRAGYERHGRVLRPAEVKVAAQGEHR